MSAYVVEVGSAVVLGVLGGIAILAWHDRCDQWAGPDADEELSALENEAECFAQAIPSGDQWA